LPATPRTDVHDVRDPPIALGQAQRLGRQVLARDRAADAPQQLLGLALVQRVDVLVAPDARHAHHVRRLHGARV